MEGECLKCEFRRRLRKCSARSSCFHKQSQADGAAPCLHGRRPGHLARRGMSMEGECLKCEFRRRLRKCSARSSCFHKQSQADGAAPCLHGRRPRHLARRGMSMEGECLECGGSGRLSSTGHHYMEDDLLILAFTGQLPAVLFHDLSGDGKTKTSSASS